MGLREKGFLVIFIYLISFPEINFASNPALSSEKKAWVDSLLNNMTLDEKIGQLLMIPVYSNKNDKYYSDIDYLISRFHIGGIIFFQGKPSRQAELTNRFQNKSKIRLFVGMDAEWGMSMRLDSIKPLPRKITLGAVQDNRLIYNAGAEIARQFKTTGMHINFAPVLDVNNNPENPVINIRSFGEDPNVVSEKGIAFMKGMQDNGIIAVGKHFPGHGDTGTDSHYALPVIHHNKSRLDSLELLPFKNAIRYGIKGIMVAHLNIPALESTPGLPSTLSTNIVTDLLKEDLQYRNLIFTDAMNMKGITSIFPEGIRELEAFKAGNDMILMPVNVPAVLKSFKSALYEKKISESEITERVRKILIAKYESGLFDEIPVTSENLTERLNINIEELNYQIFEKATTLVNNKNNLIPFRLTDTIRFASLSIYDDNVVRFKQIIDRYGSFDHFSYTKNEMSRDKYDDLYIKLSGYEVVIISVHNINNRSKQKYGMNQVDIDFINKLNNKTNVVLVAYGTPYSLRFFEQCAVLLCAYEDNAYAQETVAQQLFGAISIKGKLPVTASDSIKAGTGIDLPSIGRLGYSTPSREKFNEKILSLVDTIIEDAIKEEMIPGAQLLIARNGRIVKEMNYGHQTYQKQLAVSDSTLYDLASVTKVAGTLQILMMLVEHGYINPDKKISFYLPGLKKTNKEDLIIRDILSHQAGLIAYHPYWINTINGRNSRNEYYSSTSNRKYNVEVIPGMYAKPSLKDSIWNWMIQSELIEKEDSLKPYEYVYSDIGFYLIQRLIENVTGNPLNEFLDEYLYTPLGLKYISYLPKNKFPVKQIAPTEVDNTFRKGIIQGNVHDEIASIFGGIAGHAGLFSNAYSLGVLMQMNLQNGYYGGIQYINPRTLSDFTMRQYTFNRRGLGWDKPQIIGHEYNPASFHATMNSYGHSGFTGTYVWVDPGFDLVYIFLSNRTYPDIGNKKLIDSEVRKRIQTVIYSSLINN
jgi:beta-glucosidase-like glycosyl hydrolase/CubicO group peptidase (beta-lactamase class C family)